MRIFYKRAKGAGRTGVHACLVWCRNCSNVVTHTTTIQVPNKTIGFTVEISISEVRNFLSEISVRYTFVKRVNENENVFKNINI
jgi:hypothetical protein